MCNGDGTGNVTPLVFTTTGGIADECVRYHSRFAELSANKKGESYSSTISWIRAKVSFTIVRSAILCLRGSKPRGQQLDFVNSDLQIENFFFNTSCEFFLPPVWAWVRMSLTMKIVFLIEMDFFNWNEMFLFRDNYGVSHKFVPLISCTITFDQNIIITRNF